MFSTRESLLAYVNEHKIEQLDVRFCDLPGVQQHITVPASELEAVLDNGIMFDGSSIKGFTQIHESDMKLVADIGSAYLDPFRPIPTLNMNFSIVDPFTDAPFERDPRQVAQKAENYLRSTGIADTCYVGAEAEFFTFKEVRYQSLPHHTVFEIDSEEGYWNSGRASDDSFQNVGHTVAQKGGYFPVAPLDGQVDFRDYTATVLAEAGLRVERHHHECASGGQQEINYRFDTLTCAADDMLKFKYIVRNCALQSGYTATFMPKPLAKDNGSGMHCHLSLWKDGKPLFHDPNGYGGLSDTARWFVGGLLHHAPALLAFTNPSINSYRRLVPGFEAPINLVYSARNRSACIRIPVTGTSAAAKRVEYRVPDPTANPYLAFAACLMAGIDGIRNRIEPPAPIDKDLYELPPAEYEDIEKLPTSLEAALEALREDHEFLLEGNVFTEDLIHTWIDYKETQEIAPMRALVHPYEFELYYNI
ncbi:type I glutamate--ammonia ligase [Gleimia sp. 6138-11-ORH1]|uniref:type I glutamate--ammonia ligase n=1 Tax=Gleimia sp. 6138-11-ORH1 TaxID=2973937 RepID=UPI00216AA73E|nr:type I glutamate--ammonia ligase [Gleimia sp. 6138-11-ORH1]MCS4484318.1 type I glutamate--ammonia ligase [Gleimia sp. 6138-11-ORH1]